MTNTSKTPWLSTGIGVVVGISIAFVLVPFCSIATDVGHGTFVPFILCFPYMMIFATIVGRITLVPMLLCFVQFPAYGGLVGWSRARSKAWLAFLVLLAAHVVVSAAAACISIKQGSFLR
jgi:hypothetical protein